ncbi:AAA family ATPase [Lentzea sp. NPDC051213]|uniref:AAA family ATPase n=1 Tax=Lentzea sp. NPDC051213 TaxID=3364126 RepID=UPI00379D22F6
MPRLIHLNGPTGVGKSTIAARYAADHPKTLNLDADEIVRLVGGWREDFFGTVDLVRPLALTMAATHLSGGHDVVMPQLIARREQRDLFAEVARAAGAEYLEFVLLAPAGTAISRFHQRDHHIDHVVEKLGGAGLIERISEQFAAYLTPDTPVIETGGHDVEQTYKTLMAALRQHPGIVRPAG